MTTITTVILLKYHVRRDGAYINDVSVTLVFLVLTYRNDARKQPKRSFHGNEDLRVEPQIHCYVIGLVIWIMNKDKS